MLYLGAILQRSAGEPIHTRKHARKVTELIAFLNNFYFFNMAVTSARIVDLKDKSVEKGHFERENARVDKYTLSDELPAQLSELGLRPRSMVQPTYTVRTITPGEKERVIEFLRKFFFRDEPMNLAINLLETPDSRCIELEEYAGSTLDDEVSLAAVDENGEYAGIIINGIVTREEVEKASDEDKSDSCPNPKFKRILQVLQHLDDEAKIWEKLPKTCNSVMEVRIASIHSDWRGRGLMKVLCDETERLAQKLGVCALRMDATSAFSAAAAERLKYKKVYAVKYADLPYAPQPEAPHFEASVYVKEL